MSEQQGISPDQFKVQFLTRRMGELVAQHEQQSAELNMNIQILVQQRDELQARLDELEAPDAPEDEGGATPITNVKKKAGKSS